MCRACGIFLLHYCCYAIILYNLTVISDTGPVSIKFIRRLYNYSKKIKIVLSLSSFSVALICCLKGKPLKIK